MQCVSTLQVQPAPTVCRPRRARGGMWASVVLVVLVTGLLAGVVVGKVSDDRRQAKHAAACAAMLPAASSVQSLAKGSTRANSTDTLLRLDTQSSLLRQLQGSAADRALAARFVSDVDPIKQQISAGTYGAAVATGNLGSDSLALIESC